MGFGEETIQQTFIVPSDPEAAGGADKARDDLVTWLDHAAALFRGRDLAPTLTDVLYLPADRPFRLSATADLAGFAVSYAFETGRPGELRKIEATFRELADTLWEVVRRAGLSGEERLRRSGHARGHVRRQRPGLLRAQARARPGLRAVQRVPRAHLR